ncbi:hypothetical protein MtrunA17_Chr1g0181871 [Medicago truncatula]|uniref:Uncharacterized protein n=1 Tax=Medicago truncatula TaxID=3880 RepID=A0A396JU76_MEDTR|nr:hypothetical protein MtrunA17_Chr1g0181871 [Medicago truncatula]
MAPISIRKIKISSVNSSQHNCNIASNYNLQTLFSGYTFSLYQAGLF